MLVAVALSRLAGWDFGCSQRGLWYYRCVVRDLLDQRPLRIACKANRHRAMRRDALIRFAGGTSKRLLRASAAIPPDLGECRGTVPSEMVLRVFLLWEEPAALRSRAKTMHLLIIVLQLLLDLLSSTKGKKAPQTVVVRPQGQAPHGGDPDACAGLATPTGSWMTGGRLMGRRMRVFPDAQLADACAVRKCARRADPWVVRRSDRLVSLRPPAVESRRNPRAG